MQNSIVQLDVVLKHVLSQGNGNVCQELNTHAPAWYTKDLWSREQAHTNHLVVLTGKVNCNALQVVLPTLQVV